MQIGGSGYVLKNVAAGRIVMSKDVDFGLIRLTDDDVARSRWSALPASSLHFGGIRKMDLVAYGMAELDPAGEHPALGVAAARVALATFRSKKRMRFNAKQAFC